MPLGISIGDLIEGRNTDRTETGWGINYKLFLGLTINNRGVKTLSHRWLEVLLGVFLMTWSQEGTFRLSNLEGCVVLELLCALLRDAFNFRQV